MSDDGRTVTLTKQKRAMPEPSSMRYNEFEIVRDMIAGRAPPAPAATLQGLSMAPAAFREIDGEILARQYVAYRKLMENDEKARKPDVDDVAFSEAPMPELRGEVRQAAGEAAAPTGWLSHLTRLWRRPPAAP